VPTATPTEEPTAEPTMAPTVPPTATATPTATAVPSKLVSGDCEPADVMLVMDSSESILESDWKKFITFTHKLVQALPIGDDAMHVGVVEYNTAAKLVTKLEGDKAKITQQLDGLSKFTSGRTYTDKAVLLGHKELLDNGRGANKPRLIILLTDGLPSDRGAADSAFAKVHAAGCEVQIVTIGMMVSYLPMNPAWSSDGFPPIKIFNGYTELLSRIASITGTICKLTKRSLPPAIAPSPPITFAPLSTDSPTAAPRIHVTAEPWHEGMPAHTPAPLPVVRFPTLPPQPMSAAPAVGGGDCKPSDVMLVIDSSESILESDWQTFVKFTHKLVQALPIGDDAMHVGVVEYNTEAKLVTKLESDKAKITQQLDAGLSKFTSGRTYTDKAISLGNHELIGQGRADKPKLLVLLTDGLPSNRAAADIAFANVHAAGVAVQIVTIGMMVSYLPMPAAWSSRGFPPIKMMHGYQQLLTRIGTITGAICKLSNPKPSSPPCPPKPKLTMPPAHSGTPCRPWGHLHMDFGGDVAKFGDSQQAVLTTKLVAALKLSASHLKATRHSGSERFSKTGALGRGKLHHPTTVKLNFKFEGAKSIELGYKLEKSVATGSFRPLPDFPLIRLQMEEVYCTMAPTSTAVPTTSVFVSTVHRPTQVQSDLQAKPISLRHLGGGRDRPSPTDLRNQPPVEHRGIDRPLRQELTDFQVEPSPSLRQGIGNEARHISQHESLMLQTSQRQSQRLFAHDSGSDSSGTGMVVAIALGGVLVALMLLGVVFRWWLRTPIYKQWGGARHRGDGHLFDHSADQLRESSLAQNGNL